ncbi:MAG: ATP-dependent RNA helicase RhlE, partial [Oceanospirillales bacterium]|nr:ATP-dependent RNA helicase RhlE [Oceanospirillales bacterium]
NQLLTREVVDGFDPTHALPESRLDTRPARRSRPKKPKPQHRDGQRSGDTHRGHQPRSKGASNTPRGNKQR